MSKAQNGAPKNFYDDVVLFYEGDNCLIWPYARDSKGRGRITIDGKLKIVSRILCEDMNGAPPSDIHQAAHECGNAHLGCVTKNHLSWKTPVENASDKVAHGTVLFGERNPNSKLTESQAREILSMKGTDTQKSISKKLGVPEHMISDIHSGRSWSWIGRTI